MTELYANRYQMGDVIGKGYHGEVTWALDTQNDDALVCVKRAQNHQTSDYLQEASLLHKLHHKNIVKMVDFGVIQDRAYLVTEFHPVTVKNVGKLSAAQIVNFAIQAAEGLKHAHNLGFSHRDFGNNNVVISDDGTVKIIDWALGRLMNDTSFDMSRLLRTIRAMTYDKDRWGFRDRPDLTELITDINSLTGLVTECTWQKYDEIFNWWGSSGTEPLTNLPMRELTD